MTPPPTTISQWVMRRRPSGKLTLSDFSFEQRPLPAPQDEEVAIRVDYLAMDPAIRGFMNDSGSYASPIAPGQPVRGMVLGTVILSRSARLREGDIVWGFGTWGDHIVAPARQMHRVAGGTVAEPDMLHRRGTIGLTAYYGLSRIAALRGGDRVLVSGAAGAVGSLAGQMARRMGAAQVVGIAGGPDKCRRAVEHYGYDACIDYRAEPSLAAALTRALPDGIDVYFDNVGGEALAAAVDLLRKEGRIAICGMISGYDGAGLRDRAPSLWNLVVQAASIRGFRVTDILDDQPFISRARSDIDRWIAGGLLRADFDLREGLEHAPTAFLSLFDGGNSGRLLVRLNHADAISAGS